MKKIIPIVLCVFSLVSCSNATKNSSYYVAKNSKVNSTVEVDSNHIDKVNNFLTNSIYTLTDMNEEENFIFSPLSYYVSLASFYGMTSSNSSLDSFLQKTNLKDKNEIKNIVKSIMINSNMEEKWDDKKIASKEKISNLLIGKIDEFSEQDINSFISDYYVSLINYDDNMHSNVKKWSSEETNGLINDIDLSLDNSEISLMSSLYMDTLYGMQLSEEKGTFKNIQCSVMSGESYTDYHILTDDYESVSFKLSGVTNRGSFKIHFLKMLNENSIKDLMKKYSYEELFTDNKQKNKEKYSIKFPKNTVESKVDLQQLAARQNIPFSQFEFGNTDTEMPKYSIMNYVQNNRIMFDDYGVRCATTSASYSIPTEMANFEFVLDDNFAYTIEDPNGYIVYYGLTTSIK